MNTAQSQTQLKFQGSLTKHDSKTYHPYKFEVPAGTTNIHIDFHFEPFYATGRIHRNQIDLSVNDPDGIRGVWMKNTLIPLDILFLSADGKVLSFLQHVSPCSSGVCEVYYSESPARYMLELNAGFVRHWRIERGDKVSLFFP